MPLIHLTDIHGREHTIEAEPGGNLMEVLRQYEFGVEASCGGYCSCATCHIYVDPSWIARLPDMQSDEMDLVSILATYREGVSRLSCQVAFTADLDGIRLTVAPDE